MSSRLRAIMGIVAAWLLSASLWALAAIGSSMDTPGDAVLYGLSQMGAAALQVPAVWWLTGITSRRGGTVRFAAIHIAAALVFAAIYTFGQLPVLLATDTLTNAVVTIASSVVVGWNLLMGGMLYLGIAGVCSFLRAERDLREERRIAAEATALARAAQVEALQSRLQPHFLFNALHSLGELVHADPERADRAIVELGALLRYALRDVSQDVPLREEWAFIEGYLAFERLRLGDRLRVTLRAGSDALECWLPPLLLQPLVENAIRHGIALQPGGGVLEVSVVVESSVLEIRVRNDRDGSARRADGLGLSLPTLRSRLSLRYGSAASVSEETPDHTHLVTVRLPAVINRSPS